MGWIGRVGRRYSWRVYLSIFCDGVLKHFLPIHPIKEVFDQYFFEEFGESWRYFWKVGNDYFLVFQHFDEFGDGFTLKRAFAKEHLV